MLYSNKEEDSHLELYIFMKKVKWSKYVIFISETDYTVLFNSVSRGITVLDADVWNDIDKYISGESVVNKENRKIVAKLYQDQYIVPFDKNEIEEFKLYRKKYYNSIFGIVVYVLPTLSCNFVCPYCIQHEYIDENGVVMNYDTLNKFCEWLIKFAEEKKEDILNSMKINKQSNVIKLVFFGGEPTLENEKNFYLLDKLNNMIPSWLSIKFTIITNGYDIGDNILCEYKNRGVSGLQITLDGPQEIHDNRRTTKKHDATFNNILGTIKKCIDLNIHIVVRINVDEENVDSIEKLIDILVENDLSGKIHLNIAPVDKYSCNSAIDGHTKIVLGKFYKIYKKALFSGFKISMWESFCGVYASSFFVVSPDGTLCKCPSLLDEEHKVGSIYETEFNHVYYQILDETLEKECLDCPYVGICGGGCYNQNVMNQSRVCKLDTYVPLVDAYCRSMGDYVRRK